MKPVETMSHIEQVSTSGDVNMKPSMVVQQQRQVQMGIYTSANHNQNLSNQISNNNNQNIMRNTNSEQQQQIDQHHHHKYTSDQSQHLFPASSSNKNDLILLSKGPNPQEQNSKFFDQDGLVLPKKVLPHPISGLSGIQQQPIIRDLNRELKFNQIRGKNVLDNKSELKKALEKLEENKRKKEAEQERLNRRSSLELRLEERAERIAKESEKQQQQQQQQLEIKQLKQTSSSILTSSSSSTTTTTPPPSTSSIKKDEQHQPMEPAKVYKPLSNYGIKSSVNR